MSNRHGDAFQRALDEAGRKDRELNDDGAGPTRGARVRGVAFGPAAGSGGKARFGLALDWTDEPADRPAPQQPPPPQTQPRVPPARTGETSAEIATELGLGAALTLSSRSPACRGSRARQHAHGDRQHASRSGAAGLRQASIAVIQAAKQFQAKPNKTKENSLDLFGFIRPNRDFPMDYGESK
jgi:hypothetical protein